MFHSLMSRRFRGRHYASENDATAALPVKIRIYSMCRKEKKLLMNSSVVSKKITRKHL
jgi:hypothetical protein